MKDMPIQLSLAHEGRVHLYVEAREQRPVAATYLYLIFMWRVLLVIGDTKVAQSVFPDKFHHFQQNF